MDNKTKYLITVRFPGWSYRNDGKTDGDLMYTEHRGNGKDQYPAFGVKYLIEIPINILTQGTEPKEEMTEEDWEKLRTPEANVAAYFKEKYKTRIKDSFDGEILFIDNFDAVII